MWIVDFNAGKTQLVLFDRSNNTGAINVKMDGSVLQEKSSFKMLGLTFSSKLDWGSCMISIAETTSKKIGALLHSMKFLFPEVALYHVWNTVVTSGLVSLIFFNCYLAAPGPTSGHYREGSLTHLMLITAFYIFNPKVTGSLVVRLGP